MAGLSVDPTSGIYRIQFRFGGKHFTKSLKTRKAKEAEARRVSIEETLAELERGRLVLPPGADFWEFVKTDGKRDRKVELSTIMTVESLFDWHSGNQTPGAKEPKALKTETIHASHFKRLLGARRALHLITGQVLQEEYVNQRTKEDWYGNPIGPDTIEKEIGTLQMVWNRAFRQRSTTSSASARVPG